MARCLVTWTERADEGVNPSEADKNPTESESNSLQFYLPYPLHSTICTMFCVRMYNHTIVRDSILCPFHHHPICSLQFIRQTHPLLFLSHILPFLNVARSLILPENATRKCIYIYRYIVHVPQQPLGTHDGTLGIDVNMIRKSICMGLQHAGSLALCNPI